MESMKEKLTEYAQLLVRVGLNIQRGQPLVISSPVECAFFARLCAAEAYQAGCREVVMNWGDDELGRMKYLHAADEVFDTVPLWRRHFYNDYALEGAAYLAISASDPENLKGVDHSRIVRAQQASGRALKDFDRLQMCGGFPWCIASIPIPSWAKKVFPGMRTSTAMEKLWEAILFTSRVTDDPVKAWEEHNADLHDRCAYLNGLHIRSLHYTAENGTDLTVGMIPEGEWKGGGDTSLQGIFFNPNIPTEECFISPKRGEAEGIVYASKPLSYQGQLIENFSVRFEKGKAVEVKAEKGEELLKTMIAMDDGASYLGECALVPQHSPIAESGILFYNTLFDENAACHLALGMGFADTIKDFQNKTLDECRALGINDSMIHEDFMIGCDSMNIDGICEDGKVVPIFRSGNWAF